MQSKLEALLHRTGSDLSGSHPLIFRLPTDQEQLIELLEKSPGIEVHDRLNAQLRELIKSLNPSQQLTEESLQEKISIHLNGRELNHYGAWVYYPWSKRLVHLLDEEEFAIVRTDRNRNKITREEQLRLAKLKVGVIGLSVGQSVSMTMALERSFGEIRLADFDTLDLSNLNRIRTGTHHLGENKVFITAREIAEVDPYLKVTCFTEGLTKDNMDAFFTEGGNLDILVEECDSVDIKILARQKAKAMRIPVVMDMSDRGCLDVERFDLEPDRPLMHGWIEHLDLDAAARPMTAEEKVPYMLPITGMETLSPRMKASVLELGQSLSTWPQLASSVVLGGALAGDAVRRIALDEFHTSGRWFIDLEEFVSDRAESGGDIPVPSHARPPFQLDGGELDDLENELGPVASSAKDLDRATVGKLVEAGGAAPSAGNMQPWKFLWHERRLFLFHDAARSASFWDPDHLIAHIALGTCVENIVLKAHELGLEVGSRLFPVAGSTSLTAVFEFSDSTSDPVESHVADHLANMIGARSTNRKVVKKVPLADGVFSRLAAITETVPGCMAHLMDATDELALLAGLCGAAERIRAVNPIGHQEFFSHELRWTPEAAQSTRDGLDLATMELSPMGVAGLKVASDPRAMELIDRWRAGKGLEDVSGRAIRAASAVVLVSTANDSPMDRVIGGRAVERLWMTANAEGLAVHPISAPIFLTHAIRSEMQGLREHERAELEQVREKFAELWGLSGRHPLFMVRLAIAGEASVRSLRRPAKDLMLKISANVN